MLLQRLVEYQNRWESQHPEQVIPPEYKLQSIDWIIDLDQEGKPLGPPVSAAGDDSSRRFEIKAPYIKRSGRGIPPQLLCDKAEFILGVAGDNGKRAQDRFRKHYDLLLTSAQLIETEDLNPIRKFYDSGIEELSIDEIEPDEFITFRVDNAFIVEKASVQELWASLAPIILDNKPKDFDKESIGNLLESSSDVTETTCLICGNTSVPQRIDPVQIKMPAYLTSNQTALVSANENAFESYGLEQSYTAPKCKSCTVKYAQGLNNLLQDEQTSLHLNKAVYIFWSQNEQAVSDILNFLKEPKPEDVKIYIKSIFADKDSSSTIDSEAFYVAGFTASGGRAVVRDWFETTLDAVKDSIAHFLRNQYLSGDKYHGIFSLAASTVRDVNNDLPPQTLPILIGAALKAEPLPWWLVTSALRRSRAETSKGMQMTAPRASLIKLVFATNKHPLFKEGNMEELNTSVESPAYHCGRLLSVLEEIQEAAIPGVKSTIVDRFFGTASTAPASVFGRLVKGSQSHLGKLRKEKPGYHVNLQRKLADVMGAIHEFPRTLSLEDQGLFALGYYHQRADRYAKHEAEPASAE